MSEALRKMDDQELANLLARLLKALSAEELECLEKLLDGEASAIITQSLKDVSEDKVVPIGEWKEKDQETEQARQRSSSSRVKYVSTIQDTVANAVIKLITVCFLLSLLAIVDIFLTPVLWLWIPLGHHGLPLTNIIKHLLAPIALAGGQGIQWWGSSMWLWVHHPSIAFWVEQLPFVFLAILVVYKVVVRQTTHPEFDPREILTAKYKTENHINNQNQHKSTALWWFMMFLLGMLGAKDDDYWL